MQGRDDRETPPTTDDSISQRKRHPNPISESPAGQQLRNFVAAMNAYGDDAQDEYEKALEAIRERAEEIVIEIAQAQRRCHEDDYPFRWSLVHAAAELRHPAALPFLKNLVMTPVPPERSQNPHSFSTVAEETILRTTAVEGIEYLAEKDDLRQQATDVLFGFLQISSTSIRRATVQALLAVDDSKRQRQRIRNLLPQNQQYLLEVERKSVEDVAQIKDPQRHLRDSARQVEKEAPPRIPGQPEGDAPTVY